MAAKLKIKGPPSKMAAKLKIKGPPSKMAAKLKIYILTLKLILT